MGIQFPDLTPQKPVDSALPAKPETIPNQLPKGSDGEMASKHSRNSIDKGSKDEPFNPDAEPEYPSTRRVIPVAGALYLSFFLVALVSCLP